MKKILSLFLIIGILIQGVLGISSVNANSSQISGLVASYDLNGNAQDSSGNNNHGTASNITYETLANGNKVASFNGSNSYVSLQSNLSGKSTFSYWVSGDILKPLLGQSGNNGYLFFHYIKENKMNLATWMGGNNTQRTILPVSNNNFQHIVGKWISGYKYDIFVNGVLVGQIDDPSGNKSQLFNRLGKTSDGHYLKGKVALIKNYNKALSEQEIQQLYTEGKEYLGLPKIDGLVASYDLNGNAKDSSGNNNHGTASDITYETLANGNKVAKFNGSNFIRLSQQELKDLRDDFSASIWVNGSGTGGDYETFISRGVWNEPGAWNIRKVGTKSNGIKAVAYDLYTSQAPRGTQSTALVLDGSWKNIVVRYNKTTLTADIYINGKLYISGVQTSDWSSVLSKDTFLGKRNGQDRGYTGGMAQVKIYNSLINEDNIAKIYTEGKEYLGLPKIDGLVASYNLNGNAQDSSGKNNHGTTSNVTYETLANENKVAVFNGYNGYGVGKNPIANIGTDDFAISTWVKPSLLGIDSTLVNIGQNIRGAEDYIQLSVKKDNSIGFYIEGDGNWDNHSVVNSLSQLELNRYSLITVQRENGILKLFINGKYDNESTLGHIMNLNHSAFNSRITLGRRELLSPDHYYKGQISQTHIYNTSLTEQEIQQLYTEGKEYLGLPKIDGLIASYDLNGDAQDSSGKNNHGTTSNVTYETLANGNKVAVFNGSAKVDLGTGLTSNLNYNGDWTVGLSVYPQKNGNDLTIFQSALSSTDRIVLGIDDNNYFKAGLYNGTWNGKKIQFTELNKWYHITFGSINGELFLFVNGEKSITASDGTSTNALSKTTIGAKTDGSMFFTGKIAKTKVFNKILSEQEIQSLYQESQNYINGTDSTNPGPVEPVIKIPAAPTTVTATNIASESASYTWVDTSIGNAQETHFVLKDETGKVLINNITPDSTQIGESGLSANTQYTRVICAVNTTGEVCSASTTFTTKAKVEEGKTTLFNFSGIDISVIETVKFFKVVFSIGKFKINFSIENTSM